MTKQEFLAALQKKLSALPKKEREDRITFYSEMIDDRMEEGLSEADAVAAVGSHSLTASSSEAAEEEPLSAPSKNHSALHITLLVLCSPLWLSLLIAGFAVIISVYAVLWSVLIGLWATFGGLAGGTVGGILGGLLLLCLSSAPAGAATIGGGLVCAGLSILFFFVCKAATRATLMLSNKLAALVVRIFRKKERK